MWPSIPGVKAGETRLPPVNKETSIEQLVNSIKATVELVYQAGVAQGYAKRLEEGKKDAKRDD